MNKLFTKVATLCVGLAMAAGVGVAVGASHVSEVKATEAEAYKLDGMVQATGTAYNGDNEVTQGDVKWIVNGNVNQTPWRIGGKNTNGLSEAGAIRKIWSQDAVTSEAVSKVVVTTSLPASNSLSATSVELKVGTSKGASDTSTLSQSFGNSIVFECPSNADWSSQYFEFDFVMPQNNTGTQKFFQVSSIVFYYESSNPRGTFEIADVPHILEVGSSFTASYNWTPASGSSATVTSASFESSDAEVLSKNGDVFTAEKAGFATITLTATDSLSEQYEVVSHKVYVSNANSFAVGDKVAVVAADVLKELTGVSDGNTPYGTAADYESVPAGSFELEVESGSIDGSFAFKNTAGYLNWSSGNSLSVADSKSENTSWYVIDYDSYEVIKNCADETREIWWNNGSPRFACYTNKTPESDGYNVVSVYKLGETPVVPTLETIAVTTQPTKTEYEIGEQLDTAGLVVTATYSDQSTADVTSQCTFSGFESETAGEKTVNVFFENHSTSFNVTVKAAAPADWSADQKTAFAAELDEFVPPYVAAFGAEDAMTIYDGQNTAYGFVSTNEVSNITAAFVAAQYGQPSEEEGVYSYSVPTTNGTVSIQYGYSDTQSVGTYWVLMYTATPTGDWSDSFKETYAAKFGSAAPLPPYFNDDLGNDENIKWNANYKYGNVEVVGSYYSAVLNALETSSDWLYMGTSSLYNNDWIFMASDYSTFIVVYAYMGQDENIYTGVTFEVIGGVDVEIGTAKAEYFVGDTVDATGIIVHYTLLDGDYTSNLSIGSAYYSVPAQVLSEAGDEVPVTVVVSLSEDPINLTYNVKVVPVVVESLAISGELDKTAYKDGESWSAAGLSVEATYNNGTKADVTDQVSWSFDPASASVGVESLSVIASLDNVSSEAVEFAVSVESVYDADAFAKELLEKVAPICANYDGKKNNKTALKEIWTEMAVKYGTLSEEEKAKVVAAAAKADGTDLEKAMAFYNFACKKYGLTKFIAGRQVKAIVNEPVQSNSILPIIVIVASSVAAVTAIGVVIALKRRKSLLTK